MSLPDGHDDGGQSDDGVEGGDVGRGDAVVLPLPRVDAVAEEGGRQQGCEEGPEGVAEVDAVDVRAAVEAGPDLQTEHVSS